MRNLLLWIVICLVSFGAGHHFGYWSVINKWGQSFQQIKTERISCWERDHNDRSCIEADAFFTVNIKEY